MRTDRRAAAAGGVALIVASYSYYWAVDVFEHSASDGTSTRSWALVGLLVGPVFAVVGRWVRFVPTRRWPALACVAGVVIGEGVHLVRFVGETDLRRTGVVEIALGAAGVGFCVIRSRRVDGVGPTIAIAAVASLVTVLAVGSDLAGIF